MSSAKNHAKRSHRSERGRRGFPERAKSTLVHNNSMGGIGLFARAGKHRMGRRAPRAKAEIPVEVSG